MGQFQYYFGNTFMRNGFPLFPTLGEQIPNWNGTIARWLEHCKIFMISKVHNDQKPKELAHKPVGTLKKAEKVVFIIL